MLNTSLAQNHREERPHHEHPGDDLIPPPARLNYKM